jgi:enoyl-CoA hydratase
MTRTEPAFETIRVEREESLAWVVLDRPRVHNAMNSQMLDELQSAVRALGSDPSVRVIGLRGEGKSFCSGYDIGSGYAGKLEDRDSMDEWHDLRSRMDRMMSVWDAPVPVIAAVHGHCLMGATQLCTFCDIVIVADDAVIGSAAVAIGAGFVSPMFALAVGVRRGKELGLIPGRHISGSRAADMGWANWAVSGDALLDEVRDVAGQMAQLPRELVAANKLSMNRIAEMQGFRLAVSQLADIDVIAHRSSAARAASARLKEAGGPGPRHSSGSEAQGGLLSSAGDVAESGSRRTVEPEGKRT